MRILIIKLSSIGDVVHTLPSLYCLKKGLSRQKPEIDWIVEEAASSILEGSPLIKNLFIVKRRGWAKDIRHNLKVASLLRERRYDIVLDFQGLMKSAVWVAISNGKRKIGFSNAREGASLFYNEKLPAYDPDKHAVDRYLELAKYAGADISEVAFPISFSGAEKSVRIKLKGEGLPKDSPFFAIVPMARWKTKLWDDDKFAVAAKAISEKYNMPAVLVGGKGDWQALEKIRAAIGENAVNLAGKTDLKELFSLFKLSRLVITVDTGPMHLAAASGARCIAIFGPTAPWRTGPYGRKHLILRKELSCSPCFHKMCADRKCMEGVSAEGVIAAADKMMMKEQAGI